METKVVPAEWDSEDIVALHEFLTKSRAGQRLIPRLLSAAPLLLDGTHKTKTLVRNGELKGFQAAIQELILMQLITPEVPEQEVIGEYPTLDDDTKWEDDPDLLPPETTNPKQ